ncbi:MAG: dienelactone hydrolase family protein [Gammaproteobacteria bacterium]
MTSERVDSESVTIAGAAGELEAALDRVGRTQPAFACITCHPNPLQEGTMQNKVVTTVSRAAARLGGLSMRFNYRGVGASQGSYDGNRGELDDALAAIRYLRALPESAGLPLVVTGFSFGGAIAYRVALEAEVAALITIAPAHARIPGDASARFARWLVIHGADDEIVPAAAALQWAGQHAPAPKIVQFAATGHFYHGRLPQLADAITAYLRETVL